MSEQQPTQKKQNIIRFPASKKERRRLLRESKDKRVRLVGTPVSYTHLTLPTICSV